MKKIMILGASILQLPAIIKAKEMGFYVIAVDMNENAVGFRYADKPMIISTIDIPAVLKAAKENGIDGIVTLASDMPMRTVAAVAKDMGLIGVDEATALKTTDKAAMRACLRENEIPIPKFYETHNYDEYKKAAADFPLEYIVKPADSSGSRGIFLVNNPGDEVSAKQAYEYSKSFSKSSCVMVEEFMRGDEVSVETLSIDGICHVIQITDKCTTGAPYFVETGHSQPTRHDTETAKRISEIAALTVNVVGIKNGPAHTELMVTKDGVKVVEIGARLGGDCITTHLTPLSTGVDMVEACINIAMGERPNVDKKYEKGSAIRFFSQKSGILKSVSGVTEAKKIEGVIQINMNKEIGENVSEVRSSAERVGFVIAQADTAKKAVESCKRACEIVEIETV